MACNRFFLFLLVLNFACNENKTTSFLSYPTAFRKSGFETVGKLKVFSSRGEIRQKSIISRFNQYDSSYFNSYANYLRSDPRVIDSINFTSGQGAMLRDESECRDCSLTAENNLLILTETHVSSKCCTQGEVVTRSLPYHISMFKPEVHSEFPNSSVGGYYSFGFTGLRKYVFKELAGKLVAPLIIYNLHSKNFDAGFVNNVLQPDFYTNLAPGDTVSLREYQLIFEMY